MKNVNENVDVVSDVDLIEFEKMLSCIDSSEKSLRRLEKELFSIVLKCSNEFISRNKLTLIAKVFDKLESNELTKKAYSSKFLKSFEILVGGFVRTDKGDYLYSKNMTTILYLKKEKVFTQRIDLDNEYIKSRLSLCKELINNNTFTSLRDLYSLKNESKAVDYSNNFLKSLITLEKNQSKLKGKNKQSLIELINIARNLKLLPEKEEVGLLDSGQSNFQGKAIKKVA